MKTDRPIPKRGEKKKAFDQAHQAGLKTIDWYCKAHDWTTHLVAGGRGICKACNDKRNGRSNAKAKEQYHSDDAYRASRRRQIEEALEKRLATPGQREEMNAHAREHRATKLKSDEQFAGRAREANAAANWRETTGGVMHGWHDIERPAVQRSYTGVRQGMEIDHGVPKRAQDGDGVHVATGLHCFANLAAIAMPLNRSKGTYFSPENYRRQRPANRGPGGAFDPCPTEDEWKLIRESEALGTPQDFSLEVLRDRLDQEANAYETHYREELEPALLQRWPNAFPAQATFQTSQTFPAQLTVKTPLPLETE
ncbi:hypothetical protein SAMN04488595_102453 [Ralstonia sp. 25mfcol4.1]|nr:hypothetical protein SAMN04488595_102453 [Ralstonia sp. 25mfcol4.1]